jgi:glycosyltransferase involved in cell wall biosynthesis
MKNAGHQVVILAPRRGDTCGLPDDIRACIRFTPIPSSLGLPRSFDTLGQLWPLLSLLRQGRPDAVIARANVLSFLITLLLRIVGVSTISEHNGWAATERHIRGRGRFAAAIEEGLQVFDAKLATACRTVTDNLAAKLRRAGVRSSKIHVIGNGADPRSFHPLPMQTSRKAFGLPEDRFLVGFAGTMTVWHGLDTAVRALAQLARRRTEIDMVLFGDGPDESRIRDLADQLGVSDRVHLMGRVPFADANQAINCFDLAIAPFTARRNMETGIAAIKLGDYAAAGKPVIASALPGTKELASRGWLMTTPPDNAPALAEAILELADDPERRARMSSTARADAEGPMSWQAVAGRILDLVERLNRHRTCRARKAP